MHTSFVTHLRQPLALAALGVALLSLLLNLYLIHKLRNPEQFVTPIVADLTRDLVDEEGVISYEVSIPVGTPIAIDLPIDERFTVSVDTVIPLNTTVRVPIRGPLGVANVRVPIRSDIPLRATLPLHIRHRFQLRTATSETITVPIQLRVSDLWPAGER